MYRRSEDLNVSNDGNGRVVKGVDSGSGSFFYGYDAAGRLTGTDAPQGSMRYALDGLGRVTQRQVVGQTAVTHTYDPAGNLLTAAMGGTSVNFSYDARNMVTLANRSNGVNTSYSYDPLGRVLLIANGSLDSHSYTYDAAGQRVSKSSNPAQALQTAAISSASYDNSNELGAFGGTTYTYDGNGNRLTETNASGTTTYTWDGRNRLKQIVVPGSQGGTYSFTYDLAGNLIQQSQPGDIKSFVLDNLTNIAYQSDTSGNNFSTLSAQAIDSQLALVFPNGVEFGLTDALGSASTIADQSGSAVGKFYYEPYGQAAADPATTTLAAAYPFLFTGRVPVEGGIDYYRARFYDAPVGRFLSEDPLGLAGGINMYAYATSSPTDTTDPSGTQGGPATTVGNLLNLIGQAPWNFPAAGAGGAGAAAGGAGGITALGAATVGLAAADLALLGYDAYEGYKLIQAYGYLLPKANPSPNPTGGPGGGGRDCLPGNDDGCAQEWKDAEEICRRLLSQRNPPRNQTGGHTTMGKCMMGFVSERCGGNKIDWEPERGKSK